MPQAETIVILIRIALLALNAANQTGNYTVLRDMAAPSFREANTAARLGQIFQSLRETADLSPVALMPPQLAEPPSIDANGNLRLVGHFATQPLQINFQLQFQFLAGRWQLFGLAVGTTPATAAKPEAATTPVPAPADAKSPKASPAPKDQPKKQ